MRVIFASTLFAGALLAACNTERARNDANPAAAKAPQAPQPEARRFGARIRSDNRQPLTAVLDRPTEFSQREVVVEGHVRRACSRKGCWMELATGPDAALPGCRVSFKDYGFFVPTDSAGASARVEALVQVKTLEPAIVSHYEQEGAHFAHKNPDGSAEEVRLVANGVELWR